MVEVKYNELPLAIKIAIVKKHGERLEALERRIRALEENEYQQ